jgi:hypothetical protein
MKVRAFKSLAFVSVLASLANCHKHFQQRDLRASRSCIFCSI